MSLLRHGYVPLLTSAAMVLFAGCKPRIDSPNFNERIRAVNRISDQTALAAIALENEDQPVRMVAVAKLTDQACFAKVALESHDPDVRMAAVKGLGDQAVLARIALEDDDWQIRKAAASRLTDQVTRDAMDDPVLRGKAIAALNESDPAVRRLAGDVNSTTNNDARRAVARMKLVLQEPGVRRRLPQIAFEANFDHFDQDYQDARDLLNGAVISSYYLLGESVTFRWTSAGQILVEKHWNTEFQAQIPSSSADTFVYAGVDCEDFMAALLRLPLFTEADLTELSQSPILEVRHGAVVNLTNQAVLTKVALEDRVPSVRAAAVAHLTDRVALAKIVREDKESYIRKAAKDRAAFFSQ